MHDGSVIPNFDVFFDVSLINLLNGRVSMI